MAADQVVAVVLAGGFGTRIQHLLGEVPKPMAPVLGRPFVEWVVRYLAGQGVRTVVLSTGHRAETVARHFAPSRVAGVSVRCVPETQPLGTAGGFLHAVAATPERPAAWLVLNGDSLALAPLPALLQALDAPEVAGALLAVSMAEASRYGTVRTDEHGLLTGFLEKRPGAGHINAGMYLLRAETLACFPAPRPLSFETDVFPALIASRARLKVCTVDAPFLDIGTPESLPRAEEFVRAHPLSFLA